MFTGSLSTEPQSIGRRSLSTPIESAVTASLLQWGAANPHNPVRDPNPTGFCDARVARFFSLGYSKHDLLSRQFDLSQPKFNHEPNGCGLTLRITLAGQ
jgi:hypothetical protein